MPPNFVMNLVVGIVLAMIGAIGLILRYKYFGWVMLGPGTCLILHPLWAWINAMINA